MRPPLLDLIAAYGSGRTDFPFASLPTACRSWALQSGLGPLLARTCRDDPAAAGAPGWAEVRGADLAARVETEDLADATAELIEACLPRVGLITLLKGIWLSHAVYPEPHLRPMRDVDVMVEPDAVAEVEQVLLGLGYSPAPGCDPAEYRDHHHAVPYRHPATAVCVEVHRRLLPAHGGYGADGVFEAAHVRACLREGLFRGRPARHLSDELQVVHLAAHWAGSGKATGSAGGQVVWLDLLSLAPIVDWPRVLDEVPGTAAASALVLLTSYLQARGLLALDPQVREALWRSQRSFGKANLAFLRWLIDRRLAVGRPYGRWVLSRYNVEVVWGTLLRPRPSLANLAALPSALWRAHWGGHAPTGRPPRS